MFAENNLLNYSTLQPKHFCFSGERW